MGETMVENTVFSSLTDSRKAFDMLAGATFERSYPASEPQADRLFVKLAHLEEVYPGFRNWYWGKVIDGFIDGSRRAFVAGGDQVTGIVIAKRTASERKLCTVWVDSRSGGRGVGAALMKDAMSWLATDKPLITVPAERISEFQPLFKRWRFSLDHVADSMYRYGRREYVFNLKSNRN